MMTGKAIISLKSLTELLSVNQVKVSLFRLIFLQQHSLFRVYSQELRWQKCIYQRCCAIRLGNRCKLCVTVRSNLWVY